MLTQALSALRASDERLHNCKRTEYLATGSSLTFPVLLLCNAGLHVDYTPAFQDNL